jgi:hypothetical protein
MFVTEFGKENKASDFKGTTLVLPLLGAGMSPHLALHMYILNNGL